MSIEERAALQRVVDDESNSLKRRQRAEAILLLDEGDQGANLPPSEVNARLVHGPGYASNLLRRVHQVGWVKAVEGGMADVNRSRESPGPQPLLSKETEAEIAAAYATGKFTKAELARRHGVSGVTISNAIRRAEL